MKLPHIEQAVVAEQKIVCYLLSPTHEDGQHKARFFTSIGFRADDWETLATAMKAHVAEHELAKVEDSPFGIRYVVEGPLTAPDGRRPAVRSVWFIDTDADVPRFVTAYPL